MVRSHREDEEPASIVAKHNLAVPVSDGRSRLELLALKGELSAQQLATVAKYWSTCFKWWEELADDETFWSLVADRIRKLDDHRLTTGLPGACAPPSHRVRPYQRAARHAVCRKGKYDHAKRHIAYMEEKRIREQMMWIGLFRKSLKPLEARINSAVEEAIRKRQQEPTKGADVARQLPKR